MASSSAALGAAVPGTGGVAGAAVDPTPGSTLLVEAAAEPEGADAGAALDVGRAASGSPAGPPWSAGGAPAQALRFRAMTSAVSEPPSFTGDGFRSMR